MQSAAAVWGIYELYKSEPSSPPDNKQQEIIISLCILLLKEKTTTQHQCMDVHEAGRRTAAQQLTLNYYMKISSRKCHIITMDGTDLNVGRKSERGSLQCETSVMLTEKSFKTTVATSPPVWDVFYGELIRKTHVGEKIFSSLSSQHSIISELCFMKIQWNKPKNRSKQSGERGSACAANTLTLPATACRQRQTGIKTREEQLRQHISLIIRPNISIHVSRACVHQRHETRANKQRQKNELSPNEKINPFQYQNKQSTVQTHTHTCRTGSGGGVIEEIITEATSWRTKPQPIPIQWMHHRERKQTLAQVKCCLCGSVGNTWTDITKHTAAPLTVSRSVPTTHTLPIKTILSEKLNKQSTSTQSCKQHTAQPQGHSFNWKQPEHSSQMEKYDKQQTNNNKY